MSDMGNHIICPQCGEERARLKCRNCANIKQQQRRDALKIVCPVCEARYMHISSTKCRACNMRECAGHIGLKFSPESAQGVEAVEQSKPMPEAIKLGRSLREDLADEIESNACPKRAAWIASIAKRTNPAVSSVAVMESDSVAVGA